jgi:chromosome segregation ATPase
MNAAADFEQFPVERPMATEELQRELRATQAANSELRKKNIILRKELAATLAEVEEAELRAVDAHCRVGAMELRVRALEAKLGTCEHGYHLGHFTEGNRHCPGAPSLTVKAG